MGQIHEHFTLKISHDYMFAEIDCTESYHEEDIDVAYEEITQYLREHNIVYGIIEHHVTLLSKRMPKDQFPIVVSKGTPAQVGIDGKIQYAFDLNSDVDKDNAWNFRDVMRIPSVTDGEKLAEVIPPTNGINGKDIFGNIVQAKPGKALTITARKNVEFKEDTQSFYATSDGQVSLKGNYIDVHEVFEVHDTLSMKDGNLDFIGSIIVHGNVPSGYRIKALGDVKVFGMVEAAEIDAGGSIYISGGLSGLQKGSITAAENIHIGYINQGIVNAGKNLYVENSIMHSVSTAGNQVFCQRGNIIGGSVSAGEFIEAKEIGNKLQTKTEISFGVNKLQREKEEELLLKKEELLDSLTKLNIIGNKLKERNDIQDNPKLRIALLRQKHTYQQTTQKITEVNKMLEDINSNLGDEKQAKLIVNTYLYPNVMVSFGKYKKTINTVHQHIQMKLDHHEIISISL
ncbi:DUF342 domain-containing protein [Ornithinibacillus sp. L9]|uniref:DUF342 domain-containing protein n=1 Tax=Ornithinibacillus caprae TaxID=2678566 RepID=A0A6N8FPT6_9BACI|nr:FapA family protein [Ornithinibacillus caprae]MUK89889.1 DUF342 domain-containing protein [Ornithinibacillus caprae]